MATTKEFEAATRRMRDRASHVPRAIAVRYDRRSNRVDIDLSSNLTVSFSASDAQGLENARPSQLAHPEISPSGFGIHFPLLDADIYVPALLEGFLGSRKWMAARLGQKGGQSQSPSKKSAARANGKLGGRPRRAS